MILLRSRSRPYQNQLSTTTTTSTMLLIIVVSTLTRRNVATLSTGDRESTHRRVAQTATRKRRPSGVGTVPATPSATPADSTPDFTASTDRSTSAVTSSGNAPGNRRLRRRSKGRFFHRNRSKTSNRKIRIWFLLKAPPYSNFI